MNKTKELIKILGEIEKYPCIYATTNDDYSNRDKTDLAWAAVASAMESEGMLYIMIEPTSFIGYCIICIFKIRIGECKLYIVN